MMTFSFSSNKKRNILQYFLSIWYKLQNNLPFSLEHYNRSMKFSIDIKKQRQCHILHLTHPSLLSHYSIINQISQGYVNETKKFSNGFFSFVMRKFWSGKKFYASKFSSYWKEISNFFLQHLTLSFTIRNLLKRNCSFWCSMFID